MTYIRAHIRIDNLDEAAKFVSRVNSDGSVNKYMIEDENRERRVDARSLDGVIAALSDYADDMYFANETEGSALPSFIDEYRVIA